MHPDYPNALSCLGEAGYVRALYGKDHIVRQDGIGVLYDEGEDICLGNMDEHPEYEYSWSSGVLDSKYPGNLTARLTDNGIRFMDRQKDSGKPFFLTLNYQDPHPYFTCPEPYYSMFDSKQMQLPRSFYNTDYRTKPTKLQMWRSHSLSDKADEDAIKRAMATYCGQIRYVDDQVGRVLDYLEENDLIETTIVVFWSDHGELIGDYGVTHKLPIFYDSLVRVPLIVHDPSGTIPSDAGDELVELMDIFATILNICDVEQPAGSRAVPLPRPSGKERQDVFCEGGLYLRPVERADERLKLKAPHEPTQFGPGAMIRTKEWKLCAYAQDTWELYDLIQDPAEENNLIDDPAHATIRAEMQTRLIERLMCQGASPSTLPVLNYTEVSVDGRPIWANPEQASHYLEGKDAPPWLIET
jgi:arylsulfatase A-like enzyme